MLRNLVMAAAVWLLPFAMAPAGRGELNGSIEAVADETSMPLLTRDDFERDELGRWEFTDKAAWRIGSVGGGEKKNRFLEQFQASKYEPPVRSPFNIALARDLDVTDLVLDVKVRSTGRDQPHRDLCFVFGYQDPSHFYYVHVAKLGDEHANSIFVVDGKPRVSIAESRTTGTNWTDGWHHVRIERRVADGLILVYFDDMERPSMTAHDRRFTHGRVGLGSFDDTGMFDDLSVRGERFTGPKK